MSKKPEKLTSQTQPGKSENTSRRKFLEKSALAGGAVIAGPYLHIRSAHAGADPASAYTHNAAQTKVPSERPSRADIKLISDTWWDSPQYTANYPASEKAHKIMQDATVIDSLYSGVYPLQWRDEAQFDQEMKGIMASGINVLGFCCSGDVAGAKFMDAINGVEYPIRHINANPDKYMIVRTVDDIKQAKKAGKLGFYFIHQGCEFYEGAAERVGVVRQMGFGYTLLAYNVERSTGSGCAVPQDNGLTSYGKDVVRAMNTYGMIVDVSHVGDRTARDAIALSTTPAIASHSGVWKVNNTYRNLSDELIKDIAQSGGVVAPVTTALWADPQNPAIARPEIMFKHIDYIAQMLGNVDHIGYGSDYIPDPTKTVDLALANPDVFPDLGGMPKGATMQSITYWGASPDPAKYMPAVVDQMLTNGYTEEDCQKVLGGNYMRVFEQVWRA